jgi:hypothetical protein
MNEQPACNEDFDEDQRLCAGHRALYEQSGYLAFLSRAESRFSREIRQTLQTILLLRKLTNEPNHPQKGGPTPSPQPRPQPTVPPAPPEPQTVPEAPATGGWISPEALDLIPAADDSDQSRSHIRDCSPAARSTEAGSRETNAAPCPPADLLPPIRQLDVSAAHAPKP